LARCFRPFCSQHFEMRALHMDCKSVHAGSIPAVASTLNRLKSKTIRKFAGNKPRFVCRMCCNIFSSKFNDDGASVGWMMPPPNANETLTSFMGQRILMTCPCAVIAGERGVSLKAWVPQRWRHSTGSDCKSHDCLPARSVGTPQMSGIDSPNTRHLHQS
jgi:hypothetical protein